jgi:amidase
MRRNEPAARFDLLEATIDVIRAAYASRVLSCRDLVQGYLDRIHAYDRAGPAINAIIAVNPAALREAERLDGLYKTSGPSGPMHGIPVILKDQMDVEGMPTTLGSVLFKDYRPDRDSFVAARLKKAGAVIVAKATLGELGGGDTHGSLFGSTRNPYDPARTVGGSSGGPAAAVSANFAAVAVGQEGLASIRRPAAWNCIAGMRPSAGLVSRGGVYGGWPEVFGTLGPMARTVGDLATLLDFMVGYDPEDPMSARGVGHTQTSYRSFLDDNGLKGVRFGVLREPMGLYSEPGSEDFAKVTEAFDRSLHELRAAGAEIVDPVSIPKLHELLGKRSLAPGQTDESFRNYFARGSRRPFASRQEAMASPDFAKVFPRSQDRFCDAPDAARHYEFLKAHDELMTRFLAVMAEQRLDAFVHKAVEHQPTLIADGVKAPFVNTKGAPVLNTFLIYTPSVVVPSAFTRDGLPSGLCFLGRPYDDGKLIKYAYAYEQATHHRRPPASTLRPPAH